MSTAPGRSAPPKSRIVINLEQPEETAPKRPRAGRRRKVTVIVLAVLLGIALGVAGGGYWCWQRYRTGPAYTLALVVDAAQRNDMAAFDRYVDTDKIVESFVPQVTQKLASVAPAGLSPTMRRQAQALAPKVLPGVKQSVHDEAENQVRELSARAKGTPFPLLALAVAYFVKVREQGDTAQATVELKDHRTELTMQRAGDIWKIVGVKDDILANRIISSAVARGLPGLTGAR